LGTLRANLRPPASKFSTNKGALLKNSLTALTGSAWWPGILKYSQAEAGTYYLGHCHHCPLDPDWQLPGSGCMHPIGADKLTYFSSKSGVLEFIAPNQ
tara:strand:+ start:103 stop:396 length:294 start_codon:yes stop_codon:yes gene_type:complete